MTELTDRNKSEANVSELKPWLFKPGQSGNPTGRPVGARNKLTETFLEDVYAAWLEHGAQALETMAENDPGAFVKVAASLMPREATLNVGLGEQLANMLERMQDDRPNGTAPIVDITPDGDAVVTSDDDDRQSCNDFSKINELNS